MFYCTMLKVQLLINITSDETRTDFFFWQEYRYLILIETFTRLNIIDLKVNAQTNHY